MPEDVSGRAWLRRAGALRSPRGAVEKWRKLHLPLFASRGGAR